MRQSDVMNGLVRGVAAIGPHCEALRRTWKHFAVCSDIKENRVMSHSLFVHIFCQTRIPLNISMQDRFNLFYGELTELELVNTPTWSLETCIPCGLAIFAARE